MIVYFDTSALVKKYFAEAFSNDIGSLWQQADGIVTSAVAYAEAMAAFYRKKREAQVGAASFNRVVRTFQADWNSLIRVDLTSALNPLIDKLVARHVLRGFDAIHLASALVINQTNAKPLIFACFDEKLVQAARAEGMTTFPSSKG